MFHEMLFPLLPLLVALPLMYVQRRRLRSLGPLLHRLLKVAVPAASRPRKQPVANGEIQDYLFSRYEFRYNVLLEQTEYRPCPSAAAAPAAYRLVGRRELNTLVLEVQRRGLSCWDRDVERILRSNLVPGYHPLHAYMQQLPAWDGRDRITPLARRVSDDPVWGWGFRRWMLALAAQWMGCRERCANTLTPMLVSARQGQGKSTFCRLLMPGELLPYYLDKFDLNARAGAELKLGLFGLINLDEFDRYSPAALATLKNLVQLQQPMVRKAHTSFFLPLQRIASFIGTSNQPDLLADPSGSRRFLCIEVKRPIDCSPIDHEQLYAQLKWLVEHGERVWMDAEEEKELQEHNLPFSRLRPEEELFYQCFRVPGAGEAAELISATTLHRLLCRHNAAAMRGISVLQLGRTLSGMGVKKVHTKMGNKYYVLPRSTSGRHGGTASAGEGPAGGL